MSQQITLKNINISRVCKTFKSLSYECVRKYMPDVIEKTLTSRRFPKKELGLPSTPIIDKVTKRSISDVIMGNNPRVGRRVNLLLKGVRHLFGDVCIQKCIDKIFPVCVCGERIIEFFKQCILCSKKIHCKDGVFGTSMGCCGFTVPGKGVGTRVPVCYKCSLQHLIIWCENCEKIVTSFDEIILENCRGCGRFFAIKETPIRTKERIREVITHLKSRSPFRG